MINYTERLSVLMHDVVLRVPELSFIDSRDVLIFARGGRSTTEGAIATCHALTLPPSEPGYYFWRDSDTGVVTRRSEWFVTKSPTVSMGDRGIKYMISFALPRFCDQSFARSRKARYYNAPLAPWLTKLDTVVHELYHIAPDFQGIRRVECADGTQSTHCHGHHFFQHVAQMVGSYLDSAPDPETYEFLRYSFDELESRFGAVMGTSFRTFPSFPQRYIEPLREQPPCHADLATVRVEPIRARRLPLHYSEDDLHARQFLRAASRGVGQYDAFRAA
jgi:hypothetical protein